MTRLEYSRGPDVPYRVLVIDNYDSFTWNLVQYLGELGAEVTVVRNDEVTVEALAGRHAQGQFNRLLISPGPSSPAEAGISVPALRYFAARLPILGVCLGHQSIGAAFGGAIVRAKALMHGKTSLITHDGRSLFTGLPAQMTVNRYHSLAIDAQHCPAELAVTAQTADGEIMAVRHRSLPIEGVQFHPESILTEYGHDLLNNFLRQP